MTVRELLDRTDSYELTEWKAYEQAFGPLGSAYSEEILAQIHELIQTELYMAGAQVKKNPIPIPKKCPRPMEAFKQEDDNSIVNRAEFDTAF